VPTRGREALAYTLDVFSSTFGFGYGDPGDQQQLLLIHPQFHCRRCEESWDLPRGPCVDMFAGPICCVSAPDGHHSVCHDA
jgi:hypothetical protein